MEASFLRLVEPAAMLGRNESANVAGRAPQTVSVHTSRCAIEDEWPVFGFEWPDPAGTLAPAGLPHAMCGGSMWLHRRFRKMLTAESTYQNQYAYPYQSYGANERFRGFFKDKPELVAQAQQSAKTRRYLIYGGVGLAALGAAYFLFFRG